MKLGWLVAGSLCLNVALGLFVFSRQDDAAAVTAASQPKLVTRTVVEKVYDTVEVAGEAEVVREDWRVVESKDYKEYIQNLRAVGCPEETVRDIVIADINRHYASRWKALMMPEPMKYWEPWDSSFVYSSPKLRAERTALERERADLIRELLGIDAGSETLKYTMSWTPQDREEQLLAFLPEAKRRAIQEINEKAQRARAEVLARLRTGAPNTPASLSASDGNELNRIQKESTESIRAILAPQEFEQYMLRASPTANTVRSRLVGFNPTEEEFKAIYRAQARRDEFNSQPIGDPNDRAAMQRRAEAFGAASAEFNNQLRTALGEQRYADYQRVTDYVYRDLTQFAQRQNLAADLANRVYDVKRVAETEASRVRQNTSLTPEQRAAALRVIQAEAQRGVTQMMGAQAYEQYSMQGGHWLHMIGR
ncbi:MAG: hypothetical protein AB1705_05990 [Verrucomicrobiota bacterium]